MTTIYLIGAAVTFAVLAFGSAWLHTGRKYKTSDKVWGFLLGAMIWPIGWTDLETPNHRLVWYHPTFDPAAVTCEASAALPFIPRLTTRRNHRRARIKEIGNGQYPPTAFLAQEWGFALLQSFERSKT